jgi:hypothetical protein
MQLGIHSGDLAAVPPRPPFLNCSTRSATYDGSGVHQCVTVCDR